MERNNPQPGELYRHFKGNLYQIITTATHSETEEALVIYQALYGSYGVFARPLGQFMSPVERGKYPDVAAAWRFTRVEQEERSAGLPGHPVGIQPSSGTEASQPAKGLPAGAAPAARRTERPAEEVFLLFLDEEQYKVKLELLSELRPKLNRTMLEGMAASMDVVLPGKSIDEDLDLIEDHIRTRARFEGSRMR